MKEIEINISPNYKADKLHNASIEDMLDVFEDRIKHWMIQPAYLLLKYEHGYSATVHLLMSYFEGIMIYKNGLESNNKSQIFFIQGFNEVFNPTDIDQPSLTQIAKTLYKEARCGFFHDGMARGKIFFSNLHQAPLTVGFPKVKNKIDTTGSIKFIIINPEIFLKDIEAHFNRYLYDLRNLNDKKLKNKFKTMFLKKYRIENAITPEKMKSYIIDN